MPRITAYHVSTESNLSTIEPNVCDDSRRDGLLYGATVACFTTTRYKGRLPDFSPYPRLHDEGEEGYRYKMKFDPKHYYRFRMAKTTRSGTKQVHFLLLDKRRPRENVVAAFVRAVLCARSEDYDEQADWRKYFPGGEPNDFAETKVIVNVMFWHSVAVEKALVRGTHGIEKRGPRFEYGSVVDNTSWLEWLLEQVPDKSDDEVDNLSRGLGSTRI